MHATEYTLPRRPAAPQARGLGTPVTSLPGATRVDEVRDDEDCLVISETESSQVATYPGSNVSFAKCNLSEAGHIYHASSQAN